MYFCKKLKNSYMANRIMDPIGRLMGLRYKSHPWHGVEIGKNAPDQLTCFVEMVTTDTVKYEVDKVSGYLKIDRPQKYSNVLPALYGFIPQTLCHKKVAELAIEKIGRDDIKGDYDPLDICILTEKSISHGNILAEAIPIGGFRLIDRNQADDKIIAVLKDDAMYGAMREISECPAPVIERLKHYFLTYKDLPNTKLDVEITHTYDSDEAKEVIRRSMEDYRMKFEDFDSLLSQVEA
jgi:inorganic pyrophosphatase